MPARWRAQIRWQWAPPGFRASAQLLASSPSPAVLAFLAELFRSIPQRLHSRASWFGSMLRWLPWCATVESPRLFCRTHAAEMQEDAFQESECTFVFAADGSSSEEVAPELFLQDGASLQAVQGSLRFPALAPHTKVTRTLWARWIQACAPHDVAVSLTCSTAKGQALLETRALVRPLPSTGAQSEVLSIVAFLSDAAGSSCA